ncbi:MAG TPA: MauE/DoxX family redox-associated membrane protein [Candidatus Deferrimicrobium sp.]|nr:MauE/DoxX family redox-associated membrane protein [Candidatus Deferrimicrobium sp.]
MIDNELLTLVVRLAVGVTFIYASAYKIIEPGTFAKSLWYYHLVPGQLINLMALILPWVELVCGLALIVGLLYDGAVILVNMMMAAFILALGTTIVRGIDIDCGCFKAGQAATEAAWGALGFDLVLVLLTLQLLFSRSKCWRLS